MIELHLPDGTPAAINPIAVFCCQPVDGGTLIVSIGSAQIVVIETYAEVQARLKAWTKG